MNGLAAGTLAFRQAQAFQPVPWHSFSPRCVLRSQPRKDDEEYERFNHEQRQKKDITNAAGHHDDTPGARVFEPGPNYRGYDRVKDIQETRSKSERQRQQQGQQYVFYFYDGKVLIRRWASLPAREISKALSR